MSVHTSALPENLLTPTLGCDSPIEVTRNYASSRIGNETSSTDDFEVITSLMPGAWAAEFRFSRPHHPAHPVVTMRLQIKQVTSVWTAQSKGCGYGDKPAFVALMAEMKREDTELTNASRERVERERREAPLGGNP